MLHLEFSVTRCGKEGKGKPERSRTRFCDKDLAGFVEKKG